MSAPVAITNNQLPSGFSFVCFQNCYALCGQPQREDLKEFKKSNWHLVLNLRNPEELQTLDFEMPLSCKELNLDYKHIPILINGEFNKQALQQVHDLLNSNSEKKIVIHCASGTRSILALTAHFLLLGKYKKEELDQLAPQLGLNSPQMLSRLYSAIEN